MKEQKKTIINVFITHNNKFRAKVIPADSFPYEVTVGREAWQYMNKGKPYQEEIILKCQKILSQLTEQIETAKAYTYKESTNTE